MAHAEASGENERGGRGRRGAPRQSAHATLDPFGIYGTRTAHRMLAARRRRAWQRWILAALALVAGFMWWGGAHVPRSSLRDSDRQINLAITPSAIAAQAGTRGETLLVPTENGRLWSLNASGARVPVLTTDFPLRAQPVVEGDTAFVGCENGVLYAVNWRDGRVLWQHESSAPVTARPALTRLALPAPTAIPAATPAATPTATPTATPIITRVSGQPAVTPTATPIPTPVPTEERAVVVSGDDGGWVTALEARNGHVLWRKPLDEPVGNGITATDADGRALILVPLLPGLVARGGLVCLDGRTGKVQWRFPADPNIFGAQLAPPVVDGFRHVYCTDDAGTIVCLDARNGTKIWKTFARPLHGKSSGTLVPLRGEPLLRVFNWGSCLIVGGNDGGVRCFDTRRGQLLWNYDAGAAVRCRPFAVTWKNGSTTRDVLLVGSDGPAFHALDPQTGHPLWTFRTNGDAGMGAFNCDGHLVSISDEGVWQEFSVPG